MVETVQLSDYSLELLREDSEFVLYRAKAGESPSVLLLATASTRPSSETIKKLDHEYSLRNQLDSSWAVRPIALSERGAQMMLALEDPGGTTLDKFTSTAMETSQFLRSAIGLAAALGGLHKRQLIHRDLKPSHVLIEADTGRVRLTGFGIASRLRREHQPPAPPELIAGTLPYLAPEQTGRMNRSIDSRSDLYALGIILYEMLTGSLPFNATDPLEWVHCHIARRPTPPHEQTKTVPVAVSAIVMKLLAKTPEERYQTAAGVERDLKRCLREWETQGTIGEFYPAQHDIPDRLLIPEKLYGRDREIETLLAAFDRVAAGGRAELVLVSGYSGIGKSAVVNELHRSLVPPRGLFASGKFDQYKRDIPYATLAQAFQSLIRLLLTKSDEELSKWRKSLCEALIPNAQLMLGLAPELETIIGEQPLVPDLPQQDAQRRFHLVFQRFISVFAKPEHPLALFLDDLQWLDAATLDLIEDLLTQPDVRRLILIGAYRSNEVDDGHPLLRRLQDMRRAGAIIQDIVLRPLSHDDLQQLIADSIRCSTAIHRPLAKLVHNKTSGNPFFAIQFLSALVEEGLLTFDAGAGQWFCDLGGINAKGYTDNVVDLMVRKLSRLDPETQNTLKQLACLGSSAEFNLLRLVQQDSTKQMHAQLAGALSAELVLDLGHSYRFIHDRVQEAAYSMIPEERRAEAHLRIGRLLVANTSTNDREKDVFEIVNQLNRGAALISAREETEQLAELNLTAGKRAKASTAYVSALHYLILGTTLLGEAGWERRPDLKFELELHRAECEFLTGQMAEAEARLASLAPKTDSTVKRSAVACLRIDLYTTLNRSSLAIEVCLDYLRHLGAEWSPHPTEQEARREYERTLLLLGDRKPEELVDLPLMNNPEGVATLEVLLRALSPAVYTDTNLLSLLLSRMINLSLEHGNIDASCYAYTHAGGIAGARFGNYEAGFRLGQLGYDLVERRGLNQFRAMTYVGYSVFIVSWSKHWRAARPLLRQALDAANAVGDVTYAAYAWHNLIGNHLAVGDPLLDAQQQAERGLEFVRKIQYDLVIDNIATQLALIRTLRGATADLGSLTGKGFDEFETERRLSSDPGLAFAACWYWTRKLQARFFAGDYAGAVESSRNAHRLLWTSPGFLESAEAHFYGALSHAAQCDPTDPVQHRPHFELLSAHYKQLMEWGEHCPDNFENRVALVGAEVARIEGRVVDAENLYELAIRSARTNGFVHNEAVAYELAARFYAARGFKKFADAYLHEAMYCYQRWGADGKVRQLELLNPHLKRESSSVASTSTILAPTELLDLATMIKVSQAVCAEMAAEQLLDNIVGAAVEHAGAERGLLIRPDGEQLIIEAEGHTNGKSVVVQQAHASRSGPLPESIIRYVMRTRHDVILEDALSQNPFSSDSYIVQGRPRSVLSLPLVTQGKLISILYLENNLAPHVFTPKRIAVLKVLASQAAMSIEKTRLYRDLEDRERRIRRLIDSNVIGIVIWDLDGRLIDANEAFLRMLQYDREDLKAGLRWFEMTPPEWQEVHARYEAEELRSTGVMRAREKEYFRKDGTRVPVLIGAACFEGQSNQGVAYVLDLSEQKRAQEALRRSEAYLAESQSLTHTGSCAMDGANREILYWSDEMFQLFGMDPQQGLPTWDQWLQRIHPDDREKFRRAGEKTFREKAHCDIEFRIVKPDGAIRYIHGIGHPVATEDGQLLQVVGTMADITERKRSEEVGERLRQVEADLAHINRVSTMGELTASLAHEIKQPIGATVTNAEACLRLMDRDEPDLAEAREAASEAIKDARRAAEIIDRVRLLYQKGSSILEPVDLNQTIEEMIIILGKEAKRNRVTVRTELDSGLPTVTADRVQLQQALMNLMLNAFEAMQGTGGEVTITSKSTPDGELKISVHDTGVGLPAENLDHIFNAFFTTKLRGSGLGLAISRSVIQSHGGKIWASANSGRGATFQFTLPLRAATTL